MSTSPVAYDQAIRQIQSHSRIFVHGSAATPAFLLRELFKRKDELRQVELVSISTLGAGLFDDKDLGSAFFINSLFVSENTRSIVNGKDGDYIPVFLSEIPLLFEKRILPLDYALIHVSPPDKHGWCSLGTSVDIARSAVKSAKYVIAQINHRMPRTHGDGQIHLKRIHSFVDVDEPLPEVRYEGSENETARKIGQYCAELIEDRSVLQMGIGAIPDAVLACLTNHRDLGIHTEMFSDGILPLVESGIITNSYKKKHPGKIVTGFVIGSRRLYDFVDDNPEVVFLSIDYVNDTRVIRANPRAVSINSAIEIDLTGQVCSDSIGMFQYSGVGGQMDFMRGAALSDEGKPIIAMSSVTSGGDSKIVPFLKQGAGVVTTRAHVHYVVTEFGVAYLFGKNMRQRAEALRDIAHPAHREWLDKELRDRFGT